MGRGPQEDVSEIATLRVVAASILLLFIPGYQKVGQSSPAHPPAVAFASSHVVEPQTPAKPQFVIVSFDGGGDLSLWQYWRAIGAQGPARFTFFLSGAYLVEQGDRSKYHPPRHQIGTSAIGFATAGSLDGRRDQIQTAQKEGHEIATHFNGHFCDASRWTSRDWEHELDQFSQFLLDAKLDVETVGARTPCLGGDKDKLDAVLTKRSFLYDSSRTGQPQDWPTKNGQLWHFPIPSIPLHGTSRTILATDYNFYVNQRTGGDSNQALASYMDYFLSNYHGDRAPVTISHHFTRWNNGAYVEALTRFVLQVCPMPDVRCVSYRDLAKWLNTY